MGMKILTVFAVCFTFSTAIAYAYQAEFEYREGVMVGVGIGPSAVAIPNYRAAVLPSLSIEVGKGINENLIGLLTYTTNSFMSKRIGVGLQYYFQDTKFQKYYTLANVSVGDFEDISYVVMSGGGGYHLYKNLLLDVYGSYSKFFPEQYQIIRSNHIFQLNVMIRGVLW
ncbi:hypothetical protein J4G08_21820 [Candidatus Poribacteria bacterium]|nr:hypothetical protein [Candidatus Poribacteria bacterium]